MPRLLWTFAALLAPLLTFKSAAQGTIIFGNRQILNRDGLFRYDAPVTLPDGTALSGGAFTAGLFVVEGNSLTPIVTSPFRTAGFFPAGAAYAVEVPGIPTGSPATFRVRVWETAAGSYENAVDRQMLYGEFVTGQPNNNLFVQALGPSPGAIPDTDLGGIQPLTLIPEPSALAMLALAGLISLVLKGGRKTN